MVHSHQNCHISCSLLHHTISFACICILHCNIIIIIIYSRYNTLVHIQNFILNLLLIKKFFMQWPSPISPFYISFQCNYINHRLCKFAIINLLRKKKYYINLWLLLKRKLRNGPAKMAAYSQNWIVDTTSALAVTPSSRMLWWKQKICIA